MPIKLNKKEEKNKILKIAMHCFTNNGYSNTTMDDIAKKYGKSKASIYLHFKSKKSIFLALTDYWLRQFKQDLLPILHSNDEIELILSKIINKLSERIVLDLPFFKAHLEFLHHTYINSSIKNRIKKVYTFWTNELISILLPICNSIELAQKLAAFMIAVYDGFITRSITINDISIKDNIRFIEKITLSILNSIKNENKTYLNICKEKIRNES